MRGNLATILKGASENLTPKPDQCTSDWAPENIVLPVETGAAQRDFDLANGPHLYGMFAAFDDPNIEEIYCMKCAQILWTTALIAYVFKRIATKPCVIQGMFASDGAARKFALKKLTPMGKACRIISKLVDFSSGRKTGNSLLFKMFKGGFLEMFGSNSASNMKGTTAKFVFVEEPDDASENVGCQGDSIKLLFERTKLVRGRKKILGGTPALKGFSRVEEYIELSDKRVLPVKCHECGNKHVLNFENLVGWENSNGEGDPHKIFGYNKPENAVYACPHCGDCWDDYQRKENIRNTVYEAMEEGDPLCGWTPTKDSRIAGFTELNELYCCLPSVKSEQLVKDYLEAEYYFNRGDRNKQIVFVNSRLGRPYEIQDGRDDAETLLNFAKNDPESQRKPKLVPRGGLRIVVGIDTQDNRLAIVIRAHGRGRKSWLLWADEIYAKRGTENEEDPVWSELDKIVFSSFEHETGRSLYASAISIDSGGHATDAVYSWVLSRTKKYPGVKIMAVKGSSSRTDPPVFKHPEPRPIAHKDPDKMTKADRRGVKLYMVGTNKAKDYLADQLRMNTRGDGRFHFYNAEEMRRDFFDHYVAESKIPDKSGRYVWKQKSGCACEFWDCEVYAEHAARALSLHTKDDKAWDEIESQIIQSDLFSDSTPLVAKEQDEEIRERRPSKYQRRV